MLTRVQDKHVPGVHGNLLRNLAALRHLRALNPLPDQLRQVGAAAFRRDGGSNCGGQRGPGALGGLEGAGCEHEGGAAGDHGREGEDGDVVVEARGGLVVGGQEARVPECQGGVRKVLGWGMGTLTCGSPPRRR